MNSAKVVGGVVVNMAVGVADGYIECGDGVAIGWVYDGSEFSEPAAQAPVMTDDEKVSEFRAAVGRYIDEKAQGFGFDSVITAVSYADEPASPRLQSVAAMIRRDRSIAWDYCQSELDAWQAGGPEPTIDGILAGLPPFTL